jgi:NAD(P)-dependent dehydrogenase (short-subunit alcohol dehydrogenase family)
VVTFRWDVDGSELCYPWWDVSAAAATAAHLVARGWRVYAAARTGSALEHLRDTAAADGHGDQIIPIPLYVSDSV